MSKKRVSLGGEVVPFRDEGRVPFGSPLVAMVYFLLEKSGIQMGLPGPPML